MMKHNWKQWIIAAWVWVGVILMALVLLTSFHSFKKQVVAKSPTQELIENIDPRPVPIKGHTQYWREKPEMFLDALFLQEMGPPQNPWNIQEGFLQDACEYLKAPTSRYCLAGRYDVREIIQAYMLRYKARDDLHAAAMFRKGPQGIKTKTGFKYGQRVQNLLWRWQDLKFRTEPVELSNYGE